MKLHSAGEFVFDHSWAEASYAMGQEYYPKGCLAVPFTPASGRRFLTRDDEQRPKLLAFAASILASACQQMSLSSMHVLFCEEDEAEALEKSKVGFFKRLGVQYHWTNARSPNADVSGGGSPFTTFDDYLSEWKSKKRIKMRRERKRVREESGLTMNILYGADQIQPNDVIEMFDIYKSTIEKQGPYGRQYLTRKFFEMIATSVEFRQHLCLVTARRTIDNKLIAGTFNICGGENNNIFYGRYWGCVSEDMIPNLHFETCYYSAIQHCIDTKLLRVEPGSGGGDFKYTRGFDAVSTISMHYIANATLARAVENFLELERDHVEDAVDEMDDARRLQRVGKRPDPMQVDARPTSEGDAVRGAGECAS